MKYLFIDIRQSDEVYNKRFDTSDKYTHQNIQMNMIRFNVNMIKQQLNHVENIFIVCRSSSRSQFIKDKYFSDEPRIKVEPKLQFVHLKHGQNSIKLNNDDININIVGANSFNLYNITRIIQILVGLLILILGGYTYYYIKSIKNIYTVPLIILLIFGFINLFQGITNTCMLSYLLRDYIN